MQLADSVYNKTRDICNQITECIQQPVSFSSLEEETSINPIILTSISQGATQLLTQKLHTILPQKSMDSMIRMLYSQQQQDQKQQYQNTQKEEISIENMMSLFPDIPETDSQSREYCSLRKSIEDSIVLFSQMKEELQRNVLPKEEQLQQTFYANQSGNDIIDQSSSILNQVSSLVDEGSLSLHNSAHEKRYMTTSDVMDDYSKRRRVY